MMVKISTFDSGVSSAVLSQPLAPPSPNPLAPVMQGVRQLAGAVERRDQIRARTFALDRGAQLTEQVEAAYRQAQDDSALGAFDAQAFITEQFDPLVDQMVKDAPGGEAERLFRAGATDIRGRLAVRANTFESDSRGQAVALDLGNAVDRLTNAVVSNPDSYESALAQMQAGLAGLDQVLPAAAVAEFQSGAEAQLAAAQIAGEITRNPQRALARLNSGDFDDRLKPADKARLLASAQRQASTAAVVDRLTIESEIERATGLLEDGFSVPPDALEDLLGRADAGGALFGATPTQRAAFARRVDDLRQAAELVDLQLQLRVMTPADLQQIVSDERSAIAAAGNVTTPQTAARLGLAEQLLTTMNTELTRDPLSWAARVGLVEMPAITFAGEGADSGLRARAIVAERVSQYYGIPIAPLTQEEAGQLTGIVDEADSDTTLGLIATMAVGMGPAASGRAFGQIAKDRPLFGHAAGLSLQGPAQLRTARQILEGGRIMQGEGKLPLMAEDVDDSTDRNYGDAFRLLGGFRGDSIAAAKAIYHTEAIGRGDPTQFDDGQFEDALQLAVGGVRNADGAVVGGVLDTDYGMVVPPAPMTADDFNRLVGSIGSEDLLLGSVGGGAPTFTTGAQFTADDLTGGDARLVSVGDGLYVVDVGSDGGPPRYIQGTGSNGYFELDLSALLPRLTGRPAALLDTQNLSAPMGAVELDTQNLSAPMGAAERRR